jgi:hypothetical protein
MVDAERGSFTVSVDECGPGGVNGVGVIVWLRLVNSRNEETIPLSGEKRPTHLLWGLGRKTRQPPSWCVRPFGVGQKSKSQETRKGNEGGGEGHGRTD